MTNNLITLLNKIPFFDRLTESEKKRFLNMPNFFARFANGDYLIRENTKEDHALFIMLKGSAQVTKNANPNTILDTMTPGSVFGEISFLVHSPRTTNIIACEDVICFVIKNHSLEDLPLQLQVKIKDSLIELLVTRLDRLDRMNRQNEN